MSTESNKATVREMYGSIDSAQGMAPLDRFASQVFVGHFPGAPLFDREGIKAFGNGFFAACPGLRHRVEHLVAEGDFVAARLTVIGRQTRPLPMPTGALPSSNKPFEMPVINMFRFTDGQIVEQWAMFDMLGFLQQLGALAT